MAATVLRRMPRAVGLEPVRLVALEAVAADCIVVVASTGGLARASCRQGRRRAALPPPVRARWRGARGAVLADDATLRARLTEAGRHHAAALRLGRGRPPDRRRLRRGPPLGRRGGALAAGHRRLSIRALRPAPSLDHRASGDAPGHHRVGADHRAAPDVGAAQRRPRGRRGARGRAGARRRRRAPRRRPRTRGRRAGPSGPARSTARSPTTRAGAEPQPPPIGLEPRAVGERAARAERRRGRRRRRARATPRPRRTPRAGAHAPAGAAAARQQPQAPAHEAAAGGTTASAPTVRSGGRG